MRPDILELDPGRILVGEISTHEEIQTQDQRQARNNGIKNSPGSLINIALALVYLQSRDNECDKNACDKQPKSLFLEQSPVLLPRVESLGGKFP